MKRHISILAFLLSAFTAIGSTADVRLVSTLPCKINFYDYSELEFKTPGNEGAWYYSPNGGALADKAFTELQINDSWWVSAEMGERMAFRGWYTFAGQKEQMNPPVNDATTKICDGKKQLSGAEIRSAAGTWKVSNLDDAKPFIVAKYVPVYTVKTVVDPPYAGKVEGAGEYEEGEDVTLEASPQSDKSSEGYHFTKWSDESTNAKLEIKGISADATYTAYFEPNGYRVLETEIDGTLDVNSSGTYDQDLQISWAPAEVEGCDLTFDYVKVLDGSKNELAKYTTGNSATFNMKNVCGKFYDPVTVEVKYTRTPREHPWTIDVSSAGIASVRYKIGSGEYQETATNLTIAVPYGTRLEAYAIGEEFYTPDYTVDNKWIRTMPADNLTFKPTAALNGYKLTIHHEGAKYGTSPDSVKETDLFWLINGETNLNEVLVAVATNGAAFGGYWTSSDGGTQVYDKNGKCLKCDIWSANFAEGGTFLKNENIQVWAQWGTPPEHCTIRAVCDPADGGTVDPASTNVVKGENVTLAATANTGYSFCCWTNETGTVVSTDDRGTFKVNADATYTAVFTGNVYTVTYYGMDGEPEEQTKPVRFGSPYGEPPQEVTRSGYVLEGWNTHAKGKGDWIAATDIVMTAADQELYAIWEPKSEFDVIFVDKDGANGAITNRNMASGTVISAAPEATKGWKRQYYDLVGWDPPLPQTVGSSDLEFTAVWRSISDVLDCTNLLFNAVGNWEICTDDFVVGDSCMRLPKSEGNDLLSTTITEPGTLRFNWKVDNAKFVVSTNGQDIWSSEKKSAKWSSDDKETLELTGPCELRFYGASIDFINYCLIDNVTWTPKGEEKRYTLTVESAGNGGVEKSPNDDDHATGASVTISAAPDAGYAFEKWSDGSAENPRQIVVTSNATYVATFAALPPDEYTLEVLSAGHGAVAKGPNQPKYVEGTPVTITATPDAGYSFEKWSDGSTVNPRRITVISNAVYSANFTNCSYVVTFDAAGGTVSRDKKTVKYGEAYGDLPTAEKSGSVFIGWFLGETEIKSETPVSTMHDHTLVAKWKQDVGEVSAALDCANLAFTATGGWTIYTDHDFAYTAEGGNDSCLRTVSVDDGSGLTATIKESGSLSFHWRAKAGSSKTRLTVKAGDVTLFQEDVSPEGSTGGWKLVSDKRVEVEPGEEVMLKFICGKDCEYLAVDGVTWTPEGGGEPMPGKQVKITAAGVESGVFSLTIPTVSGTDYGVWTNADLTIDSWGLMDEPKPGDGNPWKVEWTILPELPQLFFRAHEVEYK